MTECNYLYLVALFSLLLSIDFWGILLMGSLMSFFGGGICRGAWSLVEWFIGADRDEKRKGYISAIRDLLLYAVCPVVVAVAGYLVYWNYHSYAKSHVGLVAGRTAGERATVKGIGLRWIDCGEDSFWMMENEVCYALWSRVSKDLTGAKHLHDRFPMSFSSAYSIREFVRNMERHYPVRGWTWRIPSEHQWKSACLAGGNEVSKADKINLGWFRENSGGKVHEIGEKCGNAWGLRDMVGNVAEYTLGEVGFELLGGDVMTSVADELRTGFGCVDDDGWIQTTRYGIDDDDEDDEDDEEDEEDGDDVEVKYAGVRLILEPSLIAYAYPGAKIIVRQSPAIVAYCNLILLYGVVFLLLEFFIRKISPRLKGTKFAWIATWSVFDDLKIFTDRRRKSKEELKKRKEKILFTLVKYVFEWLIGLAIAFALTLIIPGLPDPYVSIPESIMALVVGVLFGPIILTIWAAWNMLRSSWSQDMYGRTVFEKLRTVYCIGVLPIALILSLMIIRDYARPFWRELTQKDVYGATVVTPDTEVNK